MKFINDFLIFNAKVRNCSGFAITGLRGYRRKVCGNPNKNFREFQIVFFLTLLHKSTRHGNIDN